MRKSNSKITLINIIITILMFCLGTYRCFTYPIEALLSGRCSLEYVENYFPNELLSNIVSNILNLNLVVCGLIVFALFSKKASKFFFVDSKLPFVDKVKLLAFWRTIRCGLAWWRN
jgi:hypothetical protein